MKVLVTGQGFIDAPDDLPMLVTYDPSNLYSSQAGPNAGCPPGYVTQWRSGGRQGSYPICRLATEQYVNDPTIATRETGLVWQDYVVIIDDAILTTVPEVFTVGIPAVAQWIAKTVGDTAAAAIAPLAEALPLGKLALIGLAIAAIVWRPRGERR